MFRIAGSLRWLASVVALLVSLPAMGQSVTVSKAPAKVERRVFDPGKPSEPQPPLKPGEIALCEFAYRIEVDFRYAAGSAEAAPGGQVRAGLRIERVAIRLTMPVTIWVPKDADEHIKEHEEGHYAIAEHYYKDADKVARKLAQEALNRRVEGVGANKDAAYQDALTKLSQALCEKYVAAVKTPCDEKQARYDQITHKATDRSLKSADAVKKVLEEKDPGRMKDEGRRMNQTELR